MTINAGLPPPMPLSLPADLEPFAESYEQLTDPAVYCVELTPPDSRERMLAEAFDAWPGWGDEFLTSERVLYVGAAKNALQRLEQHRDGEFKPTLMDVCGVSALDSVWWFDSPALAFERESGIGLELAAENPDAYVHCR